jgi:hypothetical protein
VALFQVPAPTPTLWDKLAAYVRGGGGLVLVPGGDEMGADAVAASNKQGSARGLLPATWQSLKDVDPEKPLFWAPFRNDHRVTAAFAKWARSGDFDFARENGRPFVRRYWEVAPVSNATVVARYANGQPALAEKELPRGKVIQFTTPLDNRGTSSDRGSPAWHNYWPPYSSFGMVLIDQVCLYLAGEADAPELNFICGQDVRLGLPLGAELPVRLRRTGLPQAEANLKAPTEQDGGRLRVPQAREPGNYAIVDSKDRIVAGFSLNVRPEENDLERVPVEEVEGVLGAGSVLQVGRSLSLREALQATRPPPVELLPLLMLVLLLVLTVEGLLANKFYKRSPTAAGEPASS